MNHENSNQNNSQINRIPDSNLSSESSNISDYEMASVAPKSQVLIKKVLRAFFYIASVSLLILAGVGIYYLTL